MNKLVKCSAAALLAASLFSMSGQSVNAATGYQKLTHNAYAYTYSGKRANKKLYKKGSKVKVIGSINLNGKKYNIISGNVYIKASNFIKRRSRGALGNGYETQLLHNSYVYNAKGQRIKGTKLYRGHSVICYGDPIRIRGKKYIQIGNGQFVRSSNVLLSYNGPTGSDSLNHTHHNVSNNTTNIVKQDNSNSSNSITNNNSNNNSSQNSSSSTTSTANSSSTTNKSTSDNSTTDKKDSNKQDSKTQPSKSTDNKNTGKDSSKTSTGLATDSDYAALSNILQETNDSNNARHATWNVLNAYRKAYNKANNYLTTYQYSTPNASSADLRKATSDLKTAFANLDGKAEFAKMPIVKIRVAENGNYTMLWENNDQKKQVLDIANAIWGSNNAQFVKLTNDMKIRLTDGNGANEVFDAYDFVQPRYVYDRL